MNRLMELRRRREELRKKMRALIDGAEADNRVDLNEEEAAQYDELTRAIEREEQQIEMDQRAVRSSGAVVGSRVEVLDMPGEPGQFRSFGEFVQRVYTNPGEFRTQEFGSGELGGVLVPEQFLPEIQRLESESAIVRPRATVIPAGESPDASITMPALKQGPNGALGGMRMHWLDTEKGPAPKSTVRLSPVKLDPKGCAGSADVTNKLLRNAASFSSFLEDLVSGSIAEEEDFQLLMGDGVGKPLGVANCPGRIDVPRAVADSIRLVDVLTMMKHLHPRLWGNAVWIANITALPALEDMKDEAGNRVYREYETEKGIKRTLKGFPLEYVGTTPELGERCDLMLVDFSKYLIKDGFGPAIATSEHAKFEDDLTVLKAIFSVDGQGWVKEPLRLRSGHTVSPYVMLDVPKV